ncbi:unknown similar to AMEV172 [Adoxophyes honmai entomopoxvirus 'L']|uniref:Uncharacterized protein n=1 Tax=Adoxophyes honmai entomopoxvirus 'L' TaxID=1293540 RepID=A0A916NWX5_9POXV|nr:unknown similar to AMEV172 [Adoxophyes honmai entomopoxvirus 'L']CCU55482.1 unknown similar to AMEV172 [Adoxophyes honmai entomopoxvirus 'L']
MGKIDLMCIYSKECKLCQILNEFFDYLSKTNKINYNRININKIGNTLLEVFKYENIKKININVPCVYIYNNKDFIRLDNTELLIHAIKYKNSLKNTENKSKSFLDYIMIQ